MRFGFTGTRTIPDDRVPEVEQFLKWNTDGSHEFTTGACNGFDALAARFLLRTRADALHRLVVPQKRTQVDVDLYHDFITHEGGWACIEFMPKGTDYRDRNKRILDHADVLVAVAGYPEAHGKSRRSGTWQTIRLARQRSIPVRALVLHPEDHSGV